MQEELKKERQKLQNEENKTLVLENKIAQFMTNTKTRQMEQNQDS